MKTPFFQPIIVCISLISTGVVGAAHEGSPPPRESDAEVESRVQHLLDKMTLDEKIILLTGNGGHGTPVSDEEMATHPIPRLGIPALKMADGPLGVRWLLGKKATAFPSGLSMASSFDPELVGRLSGAMAIEALAKGRDMLLGPCVSIARNPRGGRNFECYGEDPYLTSQLGSAFVRRAESLGVVTSIKHVVGNDQETNRETENSVIGERALHEIYLPAVEALVQAGSQSVMASFNRLNGEFVTENRSLLTDLLKDEWGFKGFVISDWGATHSTAQAANAGLDLEMNGLDAKIPHGLFFSLRNMRRAIRQKAVPIAVVEDKVRRILRVLIQSGALDRRAADRPPPSEIGSPEHQALALQAAERGLVLLKNTEGALPLIAVRTLAVIGPNAATAVNNGSGSSYVTAAHSVSPLEGLQREALASGKFQIIYNEGRDREAAKRIAAQADAALIFVGYPLEAEGEGRDRPSLSLPAGQDELIASIASVNRRTSVVINSGGGVLMPWLDQVKGVVQAWYPGQEGGDAIAAVLTGKENFSGKLPLTFYKREEDSSSYGFYPGELDTVFYKEGILVGYRHMDSDQIKPLFPFGFGLSYTTFKLDQLIVKTVNGSAHSPRFELSVQITNTGKVAGSEVVQLYIHPETPPLPRADQELKGFQRVELSPGQSTKVTLGLDSSAFRFWDDRRHHWAISPGQFEIRVGDSSRDLPLRQRIQIGP